MRFASFQIVVATALLGVLTGRAGAQTTPENAAATPAEVKPVPGADNAPEAAADEKSKPLFSDQDAKTLAAYSLDIPKFDRFETALREMDLKSQEDDGLKEEMDHDEAKAGGIDRFVEAIEKEKPKMMVILQVAGVPAREFVLTSYSVMMAMVYADLLKAEPEAAVPPYVPRENLGFVKRYEDRLTKLFEALNRE